MGLVRPQRAQRYALVVEDGDPDADRLIGTEHAVMRAAELASAATYVHVYCEWTPGDWHYVRSFPAS